MNDIKFTKKKNGEIYTLFRNNDAYVVLKDDEGRQHHMRIDELVRDFDCYHKENKNEQ